MLYVKVDANGNPTEVAKNYNEIAREHIDQNIIFPKESVLNSNPAPLGYALVPESEPLPPKSGSKVVPDVPTKNSDGTMTRTWKYEATNELDVLMMSNRVKERRKTLLLRYIDTISPIRWESFTEAEKQEISDWRQSLLDITNVEGFPYVELPAVPNLLRS